MSGPEFQLIQPRAAKNAMDTPGAVEFTALVGRVRLSGDYGFGM